jgi:hypothetical protein
MPLFADEPHHFSRWIYCGWGARAEDALGVARRVQAMAAALAEADSELPVLWPQFAARAYHPAQAAPVFDMSFEDLGRLLDRWGRLDPPRCPAPVSSGGYSFVLIGPQGDPSRLEMYIGAGSTWSTGNKIKLCLDGALPLWRDPERAARIQGALVESWQAEWALAGAFVLPPNWTNSELNQPPRPWMTWSARPESAFPLPLRDLGPPAEVRGEHGGELRIWP